MQQCLGLYHRAVARLRRDDKDPTTLKAEKSIDLCHRMIRDVQTGAWFLCPVVEDFEDQLDVVVDQFTKLGDVQVMYHPLSLIIPESLQAARVSN